MRKDVKFGLAVGGVLLAVLVAYVLFVPPPNTTTVNLPKDSPIGPVDSGHSTESVVAESGMDRAVESAAAPATQPVGPAVTMTPPPSDVWGALLTRGPEAARDTSRPTTPAASNGVAETRTASDVVSPVVIAAPSTRPAPAGEREHVVQRGETLTSIATAAYGKPGYWQQIARANPTVDPTHLKVNTRLVLPKIDPETPAGGPAAPRSTASSAAPGTHKVARGDTLYTISVAHFGTATKWEKIYELNKSTIGSDPAKLKIGMVLKLPEREAAAAPVAGTH